MFLSTGSASAQLLSKWGHPVFTIGATPYDTISQGHGEFDGSPGFIPGYGYYPGPGPDHYPWLDGPGVPFGRRQLAGPPTGVWAVPSPAVDQPPPDAAWIIVKIPAEAELWFDQARTSQSGSYRCFVTPPLAPGRSLYTLSARWHLRDVELRRVEQVEVRPGSTVTVDFLTTDSWTGWRVSTSDRQAR
jgi:uncharacterized protein (TIGR03000 family)